MSAAGKYHDELIATARKLCTRGKGILAADESTGTIGKRFDTIKLENKEENRRAYRELLFETKDLEKYISGVILFEETLGQSTKSGVSFVDVLQKKGILVGIKVDKGLKPLAGTDGETACTGLDDLNDRCAAFYKAGARFAKWRAAYTIGDGKPSPLLIQEQAWGLARYAATCQANGLVPIVEPELMMDGEHDIEKCAYVTEKINAAVMTALHANNVLFEGMVLKPNMVLPGQSHGKKATPHEVASYTVRTLKRTLPAAVPGVFFLSGGQTEEEATLNLDAMNRLSDSGPWVLSFSFGRALQASAIQAWQGREANVEAAQAALLERARANGEAQLGEYAGGAGGEAAKASLFEKNYTY